MNCFTESHSEKFKTVAKEYAKELDTTSEFIEIKIVS